MRKKASIIVLYTLNCFLKIGGHQNDRWMLGVKKGKHSQLLKQAKPLTVLVALKNTQHRTEGGYVTMETNLGVLKWILQLCIIFKK